MDACTGALLAIEAELARREAPLPPAIAEEAFVAALVDGLHGRLREARGTLRALVTTWQRCHEGGCGAPATHEAPSPGHEGCLDFLCRAHAEGAAGAVPSPWCAAIERASGLCG